MNKNQQRELDELKHFVQEYLESNPEWEEDITDQVFLAIEANVIADTRYHRLIYNNPQLQEIVNQQLGRFVKEFTDLEVLSIEQSPKSKLIKTYSRLGNG